MRETGITIMTSSILDRESAVRRARGGGGFTIIETLVAVIILLLVSGGLARGVAYGMEQYNNSMILSEGKVLCSTLKTVIRGELSGTSTVRLSAESDPGRGARVDAFYSPNFGIKDDLCAFVPVDIDEDGSYTPSPALLGGGKLILGLPSGRGNLILSKSSYTKYDLRANVEVWYSQGLNMFTVELRIYDKAGGELVESTFNVLPLNEPVIE